MISLIVAFLTTISNLWWRTYQHAKRIEKTRDAYKKEGKTFPFELMSDVQNEMLFHRDRFLESEENEILKMERIELLKDYKKANLNPLKRGAIAFGICIPIEIAGWILIS